MFNYTRIEFWRDGQISQIVELDLESRSSHAARRHLKIWLIRMVNLEHDDNFIVKIH